MKLPTEDTTTKTDAITRLVSGCEVRMVRRKHDNQVNTIVSTPVLKDGTQQITQTGYQPYDLGRAAYYSIVGDLRSRGLYELRAGDNSGYVAFEVGGSGQRISENVAQGSLFLTRDHVNLD